MPPSFDVCKGTLAAPCPWLKSRRLMVPHTHTGHLCREMSIRSPQKSPLPPAHPHPHSRYHHHMPPIDFSQEPERSSNSSSASSESLSSVRRQLPPLEISHSPPRPILINQKWQSHTNKEQPERRRNKGKLFFLPSPVSPSPIYRIPNPFTLPRGGLASPQDVSFPATPLSLLAPTPQADKPGLKKERAVDDLVALCQGSSTQT